MIKVSLKKIQEYLDTQNFEYQICGDLNMVINGFSSLNNYKPNTMTWIKNGKYEGTNDIALCIVQRGAEIEAKTQIIASDSKKVFFSLIERFWGNNTKECPPIGIGTVISDDVIMGKNVTIGSYCIIGENVVIEDNVRIANNVSIECPCYIGKGSTIASGVVIGTDGFGYYQDEKGNYCKVPHLGGVRIGQNVEVGANTCIDRGTIDDTCIGNNVKIDNLCHIAHNVQIGENALIIAMTLLGGSAVLGENSYIAPGCVVKNQITIGKNAMVGMGAIVTKDVEESKVVVGNPAKVIRDRETKEKSS